MRAGRLLPGALVAIGVGLLWTAPALAGDPSAAEAAKPIKNDTGKRVCKMVVPTGSRFGSRVCKTADEWLHDEERAQNQMDEDRRGNRDLSPPR